MAKRLPGMQKLIGTGRRVWANPALFSNDHWAISTAHPFYSPLVEKMGLDFSECPVWAYEGPKSGFRVRSMKPVEGSFLAEYNGLDRFVSTGPPPPPELDLGLTVDCVNSVEGLQLIAPHHAPNPSPLKPHRTLGASVVLVDMLTPAGVELTAPKYHGGPFWLVQDDVEVGLVAASWWVGDTQVISRTPEKSGKTT